MNHSLHRTGTTRLFRVGVDRKLVKEFTGHSSDAVDAYLTTSHEQREKLCNIISGENVQESEGSRNRNETCNFKVTVGEANANLSCSCNKP